MSSNAHSEPAKMEQIITEFFAKSLHIILESRCPYVSSRNYSGDQAPSAPSTSSSPSSSSSFKPRDKWFNLALRDCPAALENIDFWRQSNLEPMIVDVILVQRPNCWDSLSTSPKRMPAGNYGSDNDEVREPKNVKIVERWVLQYERKRTSGNQGGSSGCKRSNCSRSQTLYKKSILLLRSLYATVRLLPAYKLFRELVSSAKIRLYDLCHRISSFVEPFTRGEEAEMQRFVFTPVETSCGRLCLSVMYNSSLDVSSEPSTPISPHVIPEYVGSPLAEPLKRFPSGPGSTCLTPFVRRHSWSFDLNRASSPSSTSPFSSSKLYSDRCPPKISPRAFDENPTDRLKKPSCDEGLPPLSPSPSPLTSSACDTLVKSLLRSESAPASAREPRLYIVPSQASQVNISKRLPPSGLHGSNPPIDKFSNSGEDEAQKKMVIFKQAPVRSSSRSFSNNDLDESVLSGALLIEDDNDFTDLNLRSKQGHSEAFVTKSQDAAVGALVQMLKKAPPLCRDISASNQHLQNSLQNTSNTLESPRVQQQSEMSSSKTTANALRELLEYSRMKEELLKHGKSSSS